MAVVAVLHPGEMGAAVGAALRTAGHDAVWLPAGRSPATRRRAEAAGLRAVDDLGGAAVVLSIVPPAAALATARETSHGGFSGTYVDANAISPELARAVAAEVAAAGATCVDGGIVGPPPTAAGTTRLYLSGPAADAVSALFTGSPLEAPVLGSGAFAASALKATYAAWTKISAALLMSAADAADRLGVGEDLRAEWLRSQPELPERLAAARRSAAAKGWRWSEEMRQIAAAFAGVGLPSRFGQAAAEVYDAFDRPAAGD